MSIYLLNKPVTVPLYQLVEKFSSLFIFLQE